MIQERRGLKGWVEEELVKGGEVEDGVDRLVGGVKVSVVFAVDLFRRNDGAAE